MEPGSRHQCMIYEGSPSKQLRAVAAVVVKELKANYRCLYLNSPAMVAGMRSYLAAAGLDVAEEVEKRKLVLSSDDGHLVGGRFDPERMLALLAAAIGTAVSDG